MSKAELLPKHLRVSIFMVPWARDTGGQGWEPHVAQVMCLAVGFYVG